MLPPVVRRTNQSPTAYKAVHFVILHTSSARTVVLFYFSERRRNLFDVSRKLILSRWKYFRPHLGSKSSASSARILKKSRSRCLYNIHKLIWNIQATRLRKYRTCIEVSLGKKWGLVFYSVIDLVFSFFIFRYLR